jgi:hypothetical protein
VVHLTVLHPARGILPLREGDTEGRVMDLVAADPNRDRGPRLLTNITIADLLRMAAESAAAVYRGHAARVAEGLKQAKYADHLPNDTLIPIAVETFGCLGAPFSLSKIFFGMCARHAATLRVRDESLIGAESSRLLRYYRQRISVSLQRNQARSIHHRSA